MVTKTQNLTIQWWCHARVNKYLCVSFFSLEFWMGNASSSNWGIPFWDVIERNRIKLLAFVFGVTTEMHTVASITGFSSFTYSYKLLLLLHRSDVFFVHLSQLLSRGFYAETFQFSPKRLLARGMSAQFRITIKFKMCTANSNIRTETRYGLRAL